MDGTRPSNKNIHKQERGHARQLGKNPLKGILLVVICYKFVMGSGKFISEELLFFVWRYSYMYI